MPLYIDGKVINALKKQVFDGITVTATSVPYNVCDKKELTLAIKASDITDGATLKVYASPILDDENYWGLIPTIGKDGIVRSEFEILEDGVYILEVVNSSSICYVKVTLEITDGTYTTWLESFV